MITTHTSRVQLVMLASSAAGPVTKTTPTSSRSTTEKKRMNCLKPLPRL